MARNFFGGRRGMVNPLAALLMQQQEQPQQPPAQIPPEMDAKKWVLPPSNFMASPATRQSGGKAFTEAVAPPMQSLGRALGGAANRAREREEEALSPQPMPAMPQPQPRGGGVGDIPDDHVLNLETGERIPNIEPTLFERLDEGKVSPGQGVPARDPMTQQGFGAVVPPGVQSAVEETVRQYGVAQSDYQGAMLAMKREFQDTPEIDEALSNAQQALDRAKMDRKQPSAWDFIAIALLNLSGQDPRMSADMVLGLGDQQRTEERLEDQVMGLQGARIQGRMGGRRDFRQSMLQQQLAEAEAQQRAQMEAGKERRWQADFGLRQQDQASSLLRALSGQEAETQRFAPESDAGKKAGVSRDLLKKLMQMDDSSLQRMLQERQQPPPQDMRQSRMFGRPGGGLA